MAEGEQIEKAYQVFRDTFLFTNRRLIPVDKQGMTGNKTEYHSLPYRSITHFSIETAGSFELDAELKIWISGTATPVQKKFNQETEYLSAPAGARAVRASVNGCSNEEVTTTK